MFNIPTIKEYFVDLEFVLGVIADGPTKSFAYRRLRYLTSKFDMYYLLDEYKEIAEMKVRVVIPWSLFLAHKKSNRTSRTGICCLDGAFCDLTYF